MKDQAYYELTPAQDVTLFQCKYSLYKRVINILPSVTISEKIDFELMTRAYNTVVERNDCLRLEFFKKRGKLVQRFGKGKPVEKIPVFSFETEEAQTAFIKKIRKSPIKYMRGIVSEPYFINTYDGRIMILLKVCHLALDMYGIGIIFKDLFAVYDALKNGTELPPLPASFEEMINKDNEKKDNEELQRKHAEFFGEILRNNPEPYYAGLHGPENKIWQKQLKHGHRGMKIFLLQNETKDYRHKIDANTVTRAFEFCERNQCTITNLLFFASVLTASRLNGNVESLLPLELYNCRVSKAEKTGGGTKAQSLGAYVTLDYKKTFEENFKVFESNQFKYCKHISFVDKDFEFLTHKIYRSSLLEIYYFLAYSFVAFEMPDGVEFNIYSNGRGALPAYIIQLLNPKTNEITMAYDVQSKITSEDDVKKFHEMYLRVISQILDNPKINISDIEL